MYKDAAVYPFVFVCLTSVSDVDIKSLKIKKKKKRNINKLQTSPSFCENVEPRGELINRISGLAFTLASTRSPSTLASPEADSEAQTRMDSKNSRENARAASAGCPSQLKHRVQIRNSHVAKTQIDPGTSTWQ